MRWRKGRGRRDGEVTLGDAELAHEIEQLIDLNRSSPSAHQEQRLLRLRNLLGIRVVDGNSPDSGYADPDPGGLSAGPLPEVTPAGLTPAVLRAAILRDGCVLVRGLIERARAEALAAQIDRAFQERERHDAQEPFDERLYLPFDPDPRRGAGLAREWIKAGGGVLAVDSPLLSYELAAMLREAGLPELVRGYLGEVPLVTADKTTLRKAEPSVGGAWHQDGSFMGDVKSLNLWLSLSRCGDDAPGLDLVPRRLDGRAPTETDEAIFPNQVSQRVAEHAAGGLPILRPIFEPGDALLFDELFLHKTASDPQMPHSRYAIENWFFGPSAFPDAYVPLAL